jgi:tetratricopeptide (TPR) repeat protein
MKNFARMICLVVFMALLFGCSSKDKKVDPAQLMTDQNILQSGDTQFNNGQYHDALQTYEKILIYHPTSDLHIDAQLRMADCYGAMDNYESQMDVLLRLLKENIIPEQVPQIYIQIGRFYERSAQFNPGISSNDSSDLKTAFAYFEKAIQYKDSEDLQTKAEAQYRRAFMETRLGQIRQAADHYNYLAEQDPHSVFGVLSRIKLLDPSDASELKTDDASILSYRRQLGDIKTEQPAEQEIVPEARPAEQTVEPPAEDQPEKSIEDDLFETTVPDTTQSPGNP